MEQTLYRKHRPRTFGSIVSQDHVKQLFKHAIMQDEIAHSYIFAGPRGTGKTTVARILAKRLNCLNPQNEEPCNACDQCIAIDKGAHMDVIEMDAASNRGIDDFRAIRDNVSYLPVQGAYKVYIIDEVHMLTSEAFNAILKTLEEPPPNCLFILATTNPEKIPSTIISRCQVIPYRNIGNTEIQQLLLDIAQTEEIPIEEEAAFLIARNAKGGVRDALVMLEQLSRFRGSEMIRPEDLLTMLGGVPPDWIESLIRAIMDGNPNAIVLSGDEVQQKGLNFEVVIQQMMDYLLEYAQTHADLAPVIPIAKSLMDLLKTLRFADNKRTLFTIELLHLSQSLQGVEPEQKSKTEQPQPKEGPKEASEDKWLQSLKREHIDLYIALLIGQYNFLDHAFSLKFQNHQQLSYDIVIRKEPQLQAFFQKHLGQSYPSRIQIGPEQTDEELDPDQLEPAAKKTLERIQTLFPDDKIRIRKISS